MKLCRFRQGNAEPRVGVLVRPELLMDLTPAGVTRLDTLLEAEHPSREVERLLLQPLPQISLADVELCAPVDQQEIWAAGVTYLRSKAARMAESEFSASAYDLVYEAERPELFFKCQAHKAVGSGQAVGIRGDSNWSVPEPELALVLNSKCRVVGYTVGNDVSARDIEGANLLYLPQAKVYERSCALGPCIVLGATEEQARQWTIRLSVTRDGKLAFGGETSASQMRRRFHELVDYLCRSQSFPFGAVLLTGTGIVPPDSFRLVPGDTVQIEISGIGTLTSPVVRV